MDEQCELTAPPRTDANAHASLGSRLARPAPGQAKDRESKRKLGRRFCLRRRGIRARSVEWPEHRTHSSRFEGSAALLTVRT